MRPVDSKIRAFTLIEILIVIAIIGIMASAIVTKSEPALEEQLNSAAKSVVSNLEYGRSLAIANNSEYKFTFSPTTNRYTLTHAGVNTALNTLPKTPFRATTDPPGEHRFTVGSTVAGISTATLYAATINNSPRTIVSDVTFDSLGSTTRTPDTTVWLAVGSGPSRLYAPIAIQATTGLARVGTFTRTSPILMSTPSTP